MTDNRSFEQQHPFHEPWGTCYHSMMKTMAGVLRVWPKCEKIESKMHRSSLKHLHVHHNHTVRVALKDLGYGG